MNEKFEALIRQAIKEVGPDDKDRGAKEATLQRFAELIVKECVRVVDDTFWSDPHEVDQAMDLIKKHFGIEE